MAPANAPQNPPRPAHLRRLGLRGLLFLALAAPAFGQAPALFSEGESPFIDGPAYWVAHFVLVPSAESAHAAAMSQLLPVEVLLSPSPSGFVAPREGLPQETVTITETYGKAQRYHASALGQVSRRLVEKLRDEGLIGIAIGPHPADIDPETEIDLRRSGDTVLRLRVSAGRIEALRSIALGDRVTSGWRIDNEVHRSIRLDSPLQPASSGIQGRTDAIDKDALEEYLFHLNRHPGRKVEASLAPSKDGEGIDLDYRVNEAKPWLVYVDNSNTGTSQTAKWQHSIGFVHRQFTNRDDILALDYMNAGGDKVHALRAVYEAPWFGQRRPEWMKRSGREPDWLAWLNRDLVPWWGLSKLRWRVAGSYSQYKATDVQGNNYEGNNWTASGALVYNVLQHRNTFVDVGLVLAGRGVETKNETFGKEAKAALFLPGLTLSVERNNEISTLAVNATFHASVIPIDSYDAANLGRFGADRTWQLLRWNAAFTHYLEPLLYPAAWRDPTTPESSTLAHEGALSFRGQYAFGHRLIPQVAQVVGGLYSVRGYPQSTAVGDDVYLGSAEYRLHIPRLFPIQREALHIPWIGDFLWAPQQPYGRADWDLILRAFVDAAYTNQNAPSANVQIPGESDQFLIGAGIGLELQLMKKLRVRVDSAWALRDSKDPTQPVRKGHQEFYFLFTILY